MLGLSECITRSDTGLGISWSDEQVSTLIIDVAH